MSMRIEQLEQYVAGDLTDAEAEAFEETLFHGAPESAAELDAILRAGAMALDNHTWNPVLAPEDRKQVLADPATAFLQLPGTLRGKLDAAHLTRVITCIPMSLDGVERLDLELGLVGTETPLKTFVDLPFQREDAAVWLACDIAIARAIDRAGPAWVRCLSIEAGGTKRLVYEFAEPAAAAGPG